jgi:hypothetical protein
MMHDQENSFIVFNYDNGIDVTYNHPTTVKDKYGDDVVKPDGEIWRCPQCDNIQFEPEDWVYERKLWNIKGITDVLERAGWEIE